MLETPERGVVAWPERVAEQYRTLGLWRGEDLHQVLSDGALAHPDRTAVVDVSRSSSYARLHQRSVQLARGLFRLGIRPRDSVVVQLPNRIEFIEVCFALFRLGARPVMAQPAHRAIELTQFIQKTSAVAHVVADKHMRFDYVSFSRALRVDCPSLRHTIVVGDADGELPFEQLFLDHTHEIPPPPRASEVALFQLSGGSTAVSKLIPRTHDDYFYSVRQSAKICGFDASTVYLAVLPVAHNFPLSSPGVLGCLYAGGKVVLSEYPAPDLAFPLIEKHGVTVTALVPALLSSWFSASKRQRDALRTLQVVQVGGARLHESAARRVGSELGCRLQQVFGMAEGLVCYTRAGDSAATVLGTQGRPMSTHDEVRVVDDDDRDLPEGECGHLLARGPYTVRGYYDSPEHDKLAFTDDGFYRTGDLVRRLGDGNLVVEGRAKDQINRGGEKIAAPEVEAQLLAHPLVEAAALVGIPDPYLGERSCAFVVGEPALERASLLTYLRQRGLATYKMPDRIEILRELPKTAVGKIDKRRLQALFDEGSYASAPEQAASSAGQRVPEHERNS